MIPNIPAPPTDNLYKFNCVTGTFLVVSSLVTFVAVQVVFINFWMDKTGAMITGAAEIFVKGFNAIEGSNLSREEKDHVYEDLDAIITDSLNESENNVQKILDEGIGGIFRILMIAYLMALVGSAIAFFIGINMIWAGYFAWRDRVQRPQDEKLLLEVEIARLERDTKRRVFERDFPTPPPTEIQASTVTAVMELRSESQVPSSTQSPVTQRHKSRKSRRKH